MSILKLLTVGTSGSYLFDVIKETGSKYYVTASLKFKLLLPDNCSLSGTRINAYSIFAYVDLYFQFILSFNIKIRNLSFLNRSSIKLEFQYAIKAYAIFAYVDLIFQSIMNNLTPYFMILIKKLIISMSRKDPFTKKLN